MEGHGNSILSLKGHFSPKGKESGPRPLCTCASDIAD